jgi:hypothetical protein
VLFPPINGGVGHKHGFQVTRGITNPNVNQVRGKQVQVKRPFLKTTRSRQVFNNFVSLLAVFKVLSSWHCSAMIAKSSLSDSEPSTVRVASST